MDQAFAQPYLDKFGAVTDLGHKAILTALIKTDLPVETIRGSLHVGRTMVYDVASRYFGAGFMQKRREHAAAKAAEALASQGRGEEHVEVVIPKPQPAKAESAPQKPQAAEPEAKPKGRRGRRDGWAGFLRAAAEFYREGRALNAAALGKAAGINPLSASRWMERAVIFAVHGKLPEPEGAAGLNAYVANPANHSGSVCPELFTLCEAQNAPRPLREVKITAGGASVSWTSDGSEADAVAKITAVLLSLKRGGVCGND